MRKYSPSLLVVIAAIMLPCGLASADDANPPTLDEVRNTVVEGLFDAPITLVEGHWEGDPYAPGGASRPTAGIAGDLLLTGDLTRDGVAESVAFLWSATGGSGTRNHVAVFARDGDRVINTATALIGDRVQIRRGRIVDGRIEVDLVQHGPDDARCCPSTNATRTWFVAGDALHPGAEVIGEPLSVSDLEGVDWRLTSIDNRSVADRQVMLTVADGQVAGTAPCNRYTGSIADGSSPGELSIGSIASTRIACVDDEAARLEQDFLAILQGANRFGYVAGELVVTSLVDGEVKALRLDAQPNPAD